MTTKQWNECWESGLRGRGLVVCVSQNLKGI